MMKKLLCLLLALSFVLPLTACDSENATAELQKLSAPVVTLNGNTAVWAEDAHADKFELSIDKKLSYAENSLTSFVLEEGQTFKIRAVGDGKLYETSDWSNSVTYTASTDDQPTSELPTRPNDAPSDGQPTSELPTRPAGAPSDSSTDVQPTLELPTASVDTPSKGDVMDERLEAFKNLHLPESEIIISLSKYTSTEIPLESYQYIQGPDRAGADSVLNLVYERNDLVRDATNVSPSYVYTNLSYSGIAEDVSRHVMMPSAETPDLYIDQIYGMVRAQMQGTLMNVKTTSEQNYFDFGTDKMANYQGWYNAYMNGFNFASDEKMYLLAGDYFTDVIRNLNLTAVNLSDFEAYFFKGDPKNPDLGTGKDYLYNTVSKGFWTVDQMIAWSNAAYKDTNNNSKKDIADRLGVLVYNGGPSAMGILPSADVSLYQVSADGKTYSVGTSAAADIAIPAWQAALASEGVHLLSAGETPNGYVDLATTFQNGDVLFALGVRLYELETQEMKTMEDEKCLIPYPKADPNAPYYVTTYDNARVGGILKSTSKFAAVSAYLQAASMTSDKILDEYYHVALKYKNSTDFGSKKMLDLVYDSICNPKWIVDSAILSVTNNYFTSDTQRPTHHSRVTADRTNVYASTYQAAASRLKSALASYKAFFDALN